MKQPHDIKCKENSKKVLLTFNIKNISTTETYM